MILSNPFSRFSFTFFARFIVTHFLRKTAPKIVHVFAIITKANLIYALHFDIGHFSTDGSRVRDQDNTLPIDLKVIWHCMDLSFHLLLCILNNLIDIFQKPFYFSSVGIRFSYWVVKPEKVSCFLLHWLIHQKSIWILLCYFQA